MEGVLQDRCHLDRASAKARFGLSSDYEDKGRGKRGCRVDGALQAAHLKGSQLRQCRLMHVNDAVMIEKERRQPCETGKRSGIEARERVIADFQGGKGS